ncbi:hypothetical protein SDC9_174435 [bioreactor metagenome]|uniref:Uncharacterized protein n=1 Tax=bioreactor metagenome TaxID=1076179 RepID=A0A645GJA2_9ZZZZ
MLLFLRPRLAIVGHELDAGVEEERPEDEEHPGELVDDRRAEGDEDAAEDEGEDDARHQSELLVLPGHAHAAEDDDEDEEVVDRQRVLGQVSREELDGIVPARLAGFGQGVGKQADADAEQDRS